MEIIMNNIYRERGNKLGVLHGTLKDIVVKASGSLYQDKFVGLGKTEKNILLSLIRLMDDDMNTVQVGGDTLEEVCRETGYGKQVVRNKLGSLYPLLEKTGLRGEYIVNPLFAIKGNETSVWKVYHKIELDKSNDFKE